MKAILPFLAGTLVLLVLICCKTSSSSDESDIVAPAPGSLISFSGTSSSATTVSWGAATDETTAQAELLYKLVKAPSAAAIDTAEEIDAVAGSDLAIDWTANALSVTIAGLTASTTYWFAAIVKDAAGNESVYSPQSVTTASVPDTSAPSIGTGIVVSGTSGTSTTVSWGAAIDDVTTALNLQYKLVKASAAGAIDTVAEANAIAGADIALDWTANALSSSVTGLSLSSTYWFAVLVRDAAGNMSLYAPSSVTTLASADTTPPTVGSGISFSGTSSSATSMSWGAASDGVTATANLQYKLVKASASSAIDSVVKANAITGADLALDWTANALSQSVTGLSASTTYWFAVLVRDAAGNMAIYTPPQSVTTSAAPDTTEPTAGTPISFSSTTGTATTATWGAATDNITASASLQYKLVRASAAADIDTVAEANAIAGANLVMNWATNALTSSVTGLSTGTTYWFAVLVRDAASNMSLYAPRSATTTSGIAANLSYPMTTNPGWTTTGDWAWGTVLSSAATDGRIPTEISDYPVGSTCYGTVINGLYSANMTDETNYLQLGPLDCSGYPNASGFRMTFDAWFHLDSGVDFARLSYSTDGTSYTIVPVSAVSGYTYRTHNTGVTDAWSPQPDVTAGEEPAWRSITVNLGSLGLNGQSTVYFRWTLSTDTIYQGAGFYVDNVNIGY